MRGRWGLGGEAGPDSSPERKQAHCCGAKEEAAVLAGAGVPRAWPSLPLVTEELSLPPLLGGAHVTLRVTDG